MSGALPRGVARWTAKSLRNSHKGLIQPSELRWGLKSIRNQLLAEENAFGDRVFLQTLRSFSLKWR